MHCLSTWIDLALFQSPVTISSMSACFSFPLQLMGQTSLSNKPSDNLSVMLSLTPLEYFTCDLWNVLPKQCIVLVLGNALETKKERLEWVMMSVLAVFHLLCLLLKCLLLMIKSHLLCYAGSAW